MGRKNLSEKEVRKARKMTEALRLRSLGLSYQGIADKMGTTVSSAHWYVNRALREMPRAEVKELRETELFGLGVLEGRLWNSLGAGDTSSADRILRVKERRAKMMGLDKPPEGFTKDEVAGILTELRVLILEEVEDPETRKRIAERVAEMAKRAEK